MQDRIPSKPNRYAVYDDAHNFLRYEYHERADEPTQVGSALNKANLLPDDVASALGLTGDPQVKDGLTALQALANTKAKIETGSYTGTGTYGSSNPNSLTFGFVPILVLVTIGDEDWMAFANNWGGVTVKFSRATNANSFAELVICYFEGQTVSWYSDRGANSQANSGPYGEITYKYGYIAIG